MWKYNQRGLRQCTVCNFRGNQGDVIIHFLHSHRSPETVPYCCTRCGYRVTHWKKAWWHQTNFHGCSEDGPLTDTIQGSFVDLPVQCIAKDVNYLKHPWALNINPADQPYDSTPEFELESEGEPTAKKLCVQSKDEDTLSDLSTDQMDMVNAVMKGAEKAEHGSGDLVKCPSHNDDEVVSLKSDHSTSWKRKRYKQRQNSTESEESIRIPPSGSITSHKGGSEEKEQLQHDIPTLSELVCELQQLRECTCRLIKVHEENIRVLDINNSLLKEQLKYLHQLVSTDNHDHSG